MRTESYRVLPILLAVAVAACAGPSAEHAALGAATPGGTVSRTEDRPACLDATPLRQALFGDLHVHTSFSFDAAANSTGATPADAYRFAKGGSIPFWPIGSGGEPEGSISIDRPLDFVAVTDHGEFLGERRLCRDPESPRYDTEFCREARTSERRGMQMLGAVITTETPRRIAEVCGESGELCLEWAKSLGRRSSRQPKTRTTGPRSAASPASSATSTRAHPESPTTTATSSSAAPKCPICRSPTSTRRPTVSSGSGWTRSAARAARTGSATT